MKIKKNYKSPICFSFLKNLYKNSLKYLKILIKNSKKGYSGIVGWAKVRKFGTLIIKSFLLYNHYFETPKTKNNEKIGRNLYNFEKIVDPKL